MAISMTAWVQHDQAHIQQMDDSEVTPDAESTSASIRKEKGCETIKNLGRFPAFLRASSTFGTEEIEVAARWLIGWAWLR